MAILTGKVAVVTGAAQGIGQAIASQFVNVGATVLCVDKNDTVKGIAARLGDAARPFIADVSRADQVASLFETVNARWGRVDVLCNNAGISGHPAQLAEYSEADFDEVINTNLKAVFLGMKYAIAMMVKGGGGSIVNISSIAGLVGNPMLSIYSASKTAIIGLTRSAALEYGPAGIRINAVCPGGVRTPLNEQFLAEGSSTAEQWIAKHALKRFAETSEIAAVVAFLASEDASFITGAAIPVDGGFTAS